MTDVPATTPLSAIEGSPLALAMRHELWLYPAIEILHIAGFVVLVGSIAIFDLRLLGLSRKLSVRLMARHLLPWTGGALIVIVPTGLLMFIAHASDFLVNPAFQLKLMLILAAGVNAALFHAGVYRGVKVTGSPGIRDDLINAGALYDDAPVIVDRHFVSSRKPDDLPDFCREMLRVLRVASG